MKGRYFCFTVVIRVNQIEVAPGVNIGVDERRENTWENLVQYREAIAKAAPEAAITLAFSHEALRDESENFTRIRSLAKAYHEQYGDDVTYMLGAYFAGAYSSRADICAHVDEALVLLRKFMGQDYLPRCIVGGFVPARVMEHIAKRGIHTVQGVIFSQYAIDNQDGDGSMCYPYYPSREHFCKPAQGPDDRIDVAVLDGWTVDFVQATYAGMDTADFNSRIGCGPIETLRPYGEEKGTDIIVQAAAQMLEESYSLNGGFGFATSIWELCLIQEDGHHKMGISGDTVRRVFERLFSRFPDMRIVPFGDVGDMFRAAHQDNSRVNYHFVHRGTGLASSHRHVEIEWYMNQLFRMALRRDLRTGERRVIDFTDYTQTAQEPPDSDYTTGRVYRNWSLMGDINQKGIRPQDRPVSPNELNERQQVLIRKAEKVYNIKIM